MPQFAGCLTGLGITTRDHVVGFYRWQIVTNGTFQSSQGGMSTPGQILPESSRGFGQLFQSGQSVAEHELQIQGCQWLIQGPERFRQVLVLYRERSGEESSGKAGIVSAGAFPIQRLERSRFGTVELWVLNSGEGGEGWG